MKNSVYKKSEKELLAERAVFRANSGIHFLDECLTHIHKGGTDAAFSRSVYILFSYNFELILKSRILLASNMTDRKELVKVIKSHNLETLSKMLSPEELKSINISTVQRVVNSGFVEYLVEILDGCRITFQDFIDVRYDFEKDYLRNIDIAESARMRKEVEILLRMTKQIMNMLPK